MHRTKFDGAHEPFDLDGAFPTPVAAAYHRQAGPFPPYSPRALRPKLPAGDTLASYRRFLLAGLLNLVQTGGLVPSQRFLISKMIAPVPADYRGQILELGAGTGALTRRLAARCPRARIQACEINPVLARDLAYNLAAAGLTRRVEVVCDAAENLLAARERRGAKAPDFILSGIPLGNLDRGSVQSLLVAIRRALAPRGLYIQFQHSLLDRKKVKAAFSRLRTVPVLLNVPPAVVYYARR